MARLTMASSSGAEETPPLRERMMLPWP